MIPPDRAGPGRNRNRGRGLGCVEVAPAPSFVMNHVIHHRAQLGLYLRLSDQPVPAIYGPSADEQG